ncbi:MaoC family dehydratase N-terminal domain-containing protein [Jatrophihabitans sp.]|uniref:FAS1-like dehydratase domain-containing protein n=1 Tax=Jatrophihabitans sp. TaxID=1932789 RepID=UPI0030C6B6BC|nr:hypothetical protein [Jatrophihabitans sp.]
MAAAVGGVLAVRVSYPVSASDIRRWAIAVYFPDRPPRQYWDAAYAATLPTGGIVAPEEFNPFAWMAAVPEAPAIKPSSTHPDSVEIRLGVPGPGLTFQLNAGMESEYGVWMRPGDVITSVTSLKHYRETAGRLGLMLITTLEDRWTNQAGELVQLAQSTSIRY